MNRILVTINNTMFLLPEGVDSGPVISAMLCAVEVTSHGYGDDQKYTRSDSQSISVTTIPAAKYVADELDALRIELAEAKKSQSSTSTSYYNEYTKRVALEKELKALKEGAAA